MKTYYPVPTGPESEQKNFLPLTLVEVSHAKKLELLERSSSTFQEALPQTQDMLARHREYQPSMAQMFQIKDIAMSQAPLRLLCERSEQLQSDSLKVKSYIALSYCWHGPDWTIADGLGRPEMGWPISTPMVYGLLNQRESPDEGVWVDQCCINQGDPLDKQLIIGSMDLIYGSARKVVAILEDVWISEAEEVLLQRVRTLEVLQQRVHKLWKPRNEDLDTLTRILTRIPSARWFRRAWCSHELQLSSDVVFLLPTKNYPLELSQDDVEDLYFVTKHYREKDRELDALYMKGAYLSFVLFSRTIYRKVEKFRGRSLICEFSDIEQLSCSSQTDSLSIAINISGYFTGEIRSPNERRWVLAMVALSAGDANVLGGIDEALMVEDRAGTPSWLNWVDDGEGTMTSVGYSKLAEPTCIRSINQYQITLDLLDFTNSTSWFPSEKLYGRAALLVSLISKAYVNDVETQPYWMSPNPDSITASRQRRLVVETLACSFECGFDWMIKQMSSAPNLAGHVPHFLGDFESRFWPTLEKRVLVEDSTESSYLDQLDHDKKSLLLLYLYFVIFERLFGFCNPSSLPARPRASPGEDNQVPVQEDDQGLFRCLCLNIGLGNKALVAVRSGWMEQGTPSMPVALSNGSCAGVRRLWFLDSSPKDGDNVWRLTEKSYMFTLMSIEENANAIKRRDQIVR